jgi:hypothetical protein
MGKRHFFALTFFALLSQTLQAPTETAVELYTRGNSNGAAIPVSGQPGSSASPPILGGFVSYSIEFSSFPDFAGNLSAPNKFSYQLLSNLQEIQGLYPYIRNGGNTELVAVFT